MSQRSLDRIQQYTTQNPHARRKLNSVIDAFDYVEDRQDQALLTRLLNRMIISPRLASAVCALGTGYEQTLATLPHGEITAFNQTIKSVGTIIYRTRDQTEALRAHVDDPVRGDTNVESLVRIAGLDQATCEAENNRFRQYKCDVPKEVGVEQCGMNTNFLCEQGVSTGGENCEMGLGNRCRLSAVGRQNKARVHGRRQVHELTEPARRAYRAAQS